MIKNKSPTSIFPKIKPVFTPDKKLFYNQFDLELSYDYYIIKLTNNHGYLYCYEKNDNVKNLFKIYFEGHIPSGGLLLSENITNLSGQTILDLGSGTGIISIFAGMKNVKKSVAVDIKPRLIEITKYNCKLNNLDNRIKILKGDLFDCIKGYKFDKIITNPPQIPIPQNNYDVQDYGGVLGWDFLDRMINNACNYLTSRGEIWIFLMDFLGINIRFGDYPTLFEKLENNGFRPKIVISANRGVRKGGVTEKMIPYILSIYPKYKFFDELGNYYNDPKTIKNKLKNGIRLYYNVKVVKCVLR